MAFQLREKFESLPASNGDFKLALRVSFVLFWLSVGLEYFNRGTILCFNRIARIKLGETIGENGLPIGA